MDLLSPKAILAGSIIAFASATTNVGMFSYVDNKVDRNSDDIVKLKEKMAKQTIKLEELKEDQDEIKKFTKFLYDSELKRQGREGG